MSRKIRVVQYGIGAIGCAVTRVLTRKGEMEIVGAIDLRNVGRDLGDIAKTGKELGVVISDDADAVLRDNRPDVVIHTTSSSLKKVYPELQKAIKAGVNVVSSTEELSYPYMKQPELAVLIDKMAKDNQVTILGTGVNPGFLMDAWPLFMTGVCAEVKEIRITRIQDASLRRIPFQKKIGAGKTVQEFNEFVKAGTLRHVGLYESITMIAAGLGWELDDITETTEPIIYETEVESQYISVKPGQVAGVKQTGYGWNDGNVLITLNFEASIGAKESYDAVYITGEPSMEVTIKGGVNGDIATSAILVNSIARVINSPKGLITMKDLVISALQSKQSE